MSPPLSVFYFLADTPRRRAALRAEPGSAERYALYGLDQLAAGGDVVAHNLERAAPLPLWTRVADAGAAAVLRRSGGTGGDLAPALAFRRRANRTDVAVATIDRMGIPLTLLARAKLLRTALVYVSVGLPERLERLGGRVRSLQLGALATVDAFVAYSAHEAAAIREALAGVTAAPVHFVPFGVDTAFFRPAPEAVPDLDVVSIGADPHRDHSLLLRIASRRPEWSFRLVVDAVGARSLGTVPANVAVDVDVPFGEVRDLLRGARAVALPVRANSYSGATTVLLQALACGRPAVVSRTAAISSGYGLVDGVNCRLVPPDDGDAFESALAAVLDDSGLAGALGMGARSLADAHLGWPVYVERLRAVLVEAVARHSRR